MVSAETSIIVAAADTTNTKETSMSGTVSPHSLTNTVIIETDATNSATTHATAETHSTSSTIIPGTISTPLHSPPPSISTVTVTTTVSTHFL